MFSTTPTNKSTTGQKPATFASCHGIQTAFPSCISCSDHLQCSLYRIRSKEYWHTGPTSYNHPCSTPGNEIDKVPCLCFRCGDGMRLPAADGRFLSCLLVPISVYQRLSVGMTSLPCFNSALSSLYSLESPTPHTSTYLPETTMALCCISGGSSMR